MTQEAKPIIALLGEFSAGKSTLANLLLGSTQSAVRVTATRMPPIWYVSGDGPSLHVARDGQETLFNGSDVDDLDLDATQSIRVPLAAPILDRFDLIDMPGSSDPNMPGDIWGELLPRVDIAIWCTPATQAWRQSEAALWEAVPEALRRRSLLLLTRIDKVDGAADKARVLRRVQLETRDMFRDILPVSLVGVDGDIGLHVASGLDTFMAALDDVLMYPEPQAHGEPTAAKPTLDTAVATIRPRRIEARNASPLAAPRPRRVTSQDRLI